MHIAIKGHFGQVLWTGAFGQHSMPCIITALELACADRDTVNGARKIPAIKQVARKKRMAE